jgi:branched-chain amino acid transport system substrate-binding protein
MWAHEIEAIMRERLWYSFGRAGIEIPFPVRHLLLENREGREAEPAPDFESVLAGVDILKPLNSRELSEVAGTVRSYSYAPGETVLRAGDAGDSMFIIYRGQAEVLAPDTAGKSRQVAVLRSGNTIGEMGLFTGETRSADVRAIGELEILEIRKATIHRLLTENRLLAEAFSSVIGGRQAQLDRLSQLPAGEEKAATGETILQRILRFFSLT